MGFIIVNTAAICFGPTPTRTWLYIPVKMHNLCSSRFLLYSENLDSENAIFAFTMGNLLRNWWRRASAASKTDAVLAILSVVAKVYSIGFGIWVPVSRYLSKDFNSPRAFIGFVVSMLFVVIVPLLPKRQSKKWLKEEVRRAQAVSAAVVQTSFALAKKNLLKTDQLTIFQRLLSAIKSEIEALTGDRESLFLNVSLLVEEPNDPQTLTVICRANQDRQNASYKKRDLFIAESLDQGSLVYNPEISIPGKPYRSIIGIGLLSELPGGLTPLGVLSIDSSEVHHFDGLENIIETRLLTYVSLLKLVIVVGRDFGEGRQHAKKRNPKAIAKPKPPNADRETDSESNN
jgi:hypothetical protein